MINLICKSKTIDKFVKSAENKTDPHKEVSKKQKYPLNKEIHEDNVIEWVYSY